MRKTTQQDGITLLITLLLMGALLGISTSLLNITLKQFQLAGLVAESETAFQAASAAMDCALYNDYALFKDLDPGAGVNLSTTEHMFDIPVDGSEQPIDVRIECVGDGDHGLSYSNSGYIDPTEAPSPAAVAGGAAVPSGGHRTLNGGEMRFTELTVSPGTADDPELCSEVSVYKFNGGSEVTVNDRKLWNPNGDNRCPTGAVCTVVRARGYNVPCTQRATAKQVVERELVQVY